MNSSYLEVIPCTPQVYAVIGPINRWVNELKSFGGRYSPTPVHCFFFRIGYNGIEPLKTFIQKVNSGKITPTKPLPTYEQLKPIVNLSKYQTTSEPQTLYGSIIYGNICTELYQSITYHLPRPFVGQRVIVTYNDKSNEYIILQITGSLTYVDSFIGEDKNGYYLRAIVKEGRWSIDLPLNKEENFQFYTL